MSKTRKNEQPRVTAAAFCEASEPIETLLRRGFDLRMGVNVNRSSVPISRINTSRIRSGESNSGRLARPIDNDRVQTLTDAMPGGGDKQMPPVILYGQPEDGKCPDGAHRIIAAAESEMFSHVNAYIIDDGSLNDSSYRRLSVVANAVLNGHRNDDDWRAEMAIEEWLESGALLCDSDRVARLYEIKPETFRERCRAEIVCNVLRQCEETRRTFAWFSQRCRSLLHDLMPDTRSIGMLASVFYTHRIKNVDYIRTAVASVRARITVRTRQEVIAQIDRQYREEAEEKRCPLRTDPLRVRKAAELLIANLSRPDGLGGIGFRSGEISAITEKLDLLRDIICKAIGKDGGEAKP